MKNPTINAELAENPEKFLGRSASTSEVERVMTVTRRWFVGRAGLAAAATPTVLSAIAEAAQGPSRAQASRKTSRARDLTDQELEAMFHRCSNTGKWGPNDEL